MKMRIRRMLKLASGMIAAADHALADKDTPLPGTLMLRIYQAQRARTVPAKRQKFSPGEKRMALDAMRTAGLGPTWVANQLLISVRTVRRWLAEERAGNAGDADTAAHNRHCDEVRLAVHAAKRLLGQSASVRKIAFALLRGGIQMGGETVRQILMEEPPKRKTARARTKAQVAEIAPAVEPFGPLAPEKANDAWHLDLTEKHFWRFSFCMLAVMDGRSRKNLVSQWFIKTPDTEAILDVVRKLTAKHGKPKAICTDHGGQFKGKFKQGLFALGITHAQGRPRNPRFNGKIERFFKTLKWDLFKLAPLVLLRPFKAQGVLDDYAHWYNHERPHLALGGLTPTEVWNNIPRKQPVAYRARDKLRIQIKTTRTNHRGLSCCPILNFEVTVENNQAA